MSCRSTPPPLCAFLNKGGGQVLFKLMTEEVRVGGIGAWQA